MVSVSVVVVSCPVLSSGGAGFGGALSRVILGSSRVILIRESGNTPNLPRNRAKGANRAKTGAKLPIYIGIFRAFRSFRQKSKFRHG